MSKTDKLPKCPECDTNENVYQEKENLFGCRWCMSHGIAGLFSREEAGERYGKDD